MSSVIDSLAGQDFAQAERYANDQNLLQTDVEVASIVLGVVKKHIPGIDVGASVTDGEIVRDIAAASQVTITVHDQKRTIVRDPNLYNEGGFLRDIDLELDDLWFRLATVEKQGDSTLLTFEDRDVSFLRSLIGPRKIGSRAKVTRAMAILQLIRAVKERRIPVRINELRLKQPIAPPTGSDKVDALKTKKERDKNKQKGFPDGFKMKGVTGAMLRNMTVALDEAEKLKASERVMLTMLVAGFGESGWLKSAAEKIYGTHKGVFQSDVIPADHLREQAHYFLVGGRSFAKGGAIKAVRDNPTWTVGMVAAHVEVSDGSAAYYDGFFKQARKLMDAWGGGGSRPSSRRKHYSFQVNKKETYWDAIIRMANEVNWRAFFVGGIFYYISEEDLFDSRPRYKFSEDSPGIENIDFTHDRRRKVMKATVTARINRWAIPPGVIVQIDDMGSASGKWLVESTTRSIFSSEATISLSKPLPEKAEPFPGFTSTSSSSGAKNNDAVITTGQLQDRLFQAAQEIGRHKYPYVWGGGHKKAGTPDKGAHRPQDGGKEGYDCSGGVAACLFYGDALPKDLQSNVPRSDIFAESLGWRKGEGNYVTAWANASHMFLEVKQNGKWVHLGTGRFGKSFSGFGVCGSLHSHAGFTPYCPRPDGIRQVPFQHQHVA